MPVNIPFLCLALGLLAVAQAPPAGISRSSFGALPDGRAVDLYTLRNRHGLSVAITNYGGTVVSIQAPDQKGRPAEVALGYPALEGYLQGTAYFGALIGRYGNRIAGGRFSLDGHTYTLARNNGNNSLHGGLRGFDKKLWTARIAGNGLELTCHSSDGEEGFPGNLDVTVNYRLGDDGGLRIDYRATTDRDTVVNLTNHTYFNLKGRDSGDVLGTEMMIRASRFTPVDAEMIPTGEVRAVAGTPLDFRFSVPIGARIAAPDQQLVYGHGYDHNYVLDRPGLTVPVAEAFEPSSGRRLQVFTTEPGLQFYSGNYLPTPHAGFALEAQHFPDSPNHPAFPTTELKPGQVYRSSTIYKFLAR